MGDPDGMALVFAFSKTSRYVSRARPVPRPASLRAMSSMAQAEPGSPKFLVAQRALGFVEPGMRLGLGTGSTATIFVDLLAERIGAGLVLGAAVPTSERTRAQAESLGIPVTTLEETPELDLVIDGADEFDPDLRLIKGGGGALLREKIVAAASRAMIVIADSSKAVDRLGRFPLPVEVNRFGLASTKLLVARAARRAGAEGDLEVRTGPDGAPFVTDGGHLILDCRFGTIPDPDLLARSLARVPGVVETGLFIGYATAVVIDDGHGTRVISRPGSGISG